MKIKFRLWDYPLGAIEELITCSQLEFMLAEKALFIGRGRDSLFEWHHGGKARVSAGKASDADKAGAPGPMLLGSGN